MKSVELAANLAELFAYRTLALIELVIDSKTVLHQLFGIFEDLQFAFEFGLFARLGAEEGRWDYLVNTLPGTVGYRLPPSCDALLRQHTPVVRTLSSFAQESLQGFVVVRG